MVLFLKIISAVCIKYTVVNVIPYTILVGYAFACIGAQKTLFPTFVIKVFGANIGPKIFPMVFMFECISNLAQWSLNFFFFTDDLDNLINISIAMVCLSFLACLFLNENPNWSKEIRKAKDRRIEKNLSKGENDVTRNNDVYLSDNK